MKSKGGESSKLTVDSVLVGLVGTDIALFQRPPFRELGVAVGEIVVNHDPVPGARERQTTMRAYVARAAGYKNCRHARVLLEALPHERHHE